MQAKVFGSALHGVDAFRITIEVSVDKGLGSMITGLPDVGIRESFNRIGVAITANGYTMPRTRLMINLAPADVKKDGTAFDLPIALGILLASKQIQHADTLQQYIFAAELGLDGKLYPIRGALCMAYQAAKEGMKGIILPVDNAPEAALVNGINVYGAKDLKEVIAFLKNKNALLPFLSIIPDEFPNPTVDFSQVKGQGYAKRALEIMAAGGHHGLLIGPPGTGKSMLAKRLATILPPMTTSESLETTRIHSIVRNGKLPGLVFERPFVNPHHTTSDVALIGGGSFPMPGAISMAHNGVLFLDELGEFKKTAIEVLRQPMEDRKVLIARAKNSLEYPASFTLLAAMNPCSCGYRNHPTRQCTCSKRAIWWYMRKLSGPILERIDMHIEVDPVPIEELAFANDIIEESSASIRKRVVAARQIQSRRFTKVPGIYCNAQMPDALIMEICLMEEEASNLLFKQMDRLGLSARSYSRILKVARTIADLDDTVLIELEHIAEAIHFRKLDQPIPIEKDKTRKRA